MGKLTWFRSTTTGVLKDILLVAGSVLIMGSTVTFVQMVGYSIALAGLVVFKTKQVSSRLYARPNETDSDSFSLSPCVATRKLSTNTFSRHAASSRVKSPAYKYDASCFSTSRAGGAFKKQFKHFQSSIHFFPFLALLNLEIRIPYYTLVFSHCFSFLSLYNVPA